MDCKAHTLLPHYLGHIAASTLPMYVHMHLSLCIFSLGGILLISAKATCYLCSRSPTATSTTYHIQSYPLLPVVYCGSAFYVLVWSCHHLIVGLTPCCLCSNRAKRLSVANSSSLTNLSFSWSCLSLNTGLWTSVPVVVVVGTDWSRLRNLVFLGSFGSK